MAEGRKIPYLIELAADDKKIRQQMAKINWEELLGSKGKGFGDVLVSDAKDAKDQIKRTLGGLDIDWSKILGAKEIGQLEQAVTKALSKSRKEIELFAASGDTTGLEKTIKYVSALGEELKGLGSNFDAAGLARGMGAFMKVLVPLTAKFEALAEEPKKVEAAFDRLFSGIATSAKSVDLGKTFDVSGKIKIAMQGLKATNDEILEATESLEKYRNIVAKLSRDNPATIKLAQDVAGLNQQLDEQMHKEEQLASQNKTNSAQYAATLKNIMAIENARLKLKEKPTKDYAGMEIREDFGYYEEQINKVVERISKKMEEVEGKLANAVDKSFAEIISKQISDIKLSVSLSEQAEKQFVNEINAFVKRVNQSPIEKVKIQIDDAANVIEDQTKRQYGDNEAIEDVHTENLIKKTDDRFIKIAKTIGKKQKGILRNTEEWRKKMIKAMQIGKDDLNFQFGWDGHLKESADSLFNKLQEYFEQPEYALDIKFNTEKIARDLKASLEAEGIELGVGGGTANIDAKSLMSMLHSLLYGGVPVHTTAKTSDASESFVPKEVADETDEAIDSGKEYVKVLDETTLHIDKVIESLRTFAKEANKSNASKGSKAIANELAGMGIDVSKIKKDTNDATVLKMLQDGLMTKDEMGKPQGGSLVGRIRSLMSTNGMDAEKGAGRVAEILARDIMELFDINEIETELEAQVEKRFKQLNLWQGVEKPGRALAALGNVRSTKNKVRLPEMQAINDAINYFEDAGEDTDALKKLQEARKKFEDSGQTDEAKAEFEKAALVFYDETKDVFKRLKAKWGDFRGTVSAEGRKPILINPKGAYPTRILEIPKNAVITKVEPFEAFEVVDDVGLVGSSARRESSVKKAAQQQRQLNYGSSGYDFMTEKPHPKKDVRYEDIEYDTFKTQESKNLPPDVALDATIESLEKRAAEIPELVERIEESKKNIAQLEEIKQQIENEVSNLQVQDLPEFQMNAFEQYSDRNSSITEVLLNANNALDKNDILDIKDISKLDNEQQSLVGRLKSITTNIHNDSKASQEFADKIAEIVEAKKLSKEELEIARSKAAEQGDKTRVDLYRDLLFNGSEVDNRLALYQSQKSVVDKNLGENKNYAKKLINELATSKDQTVERATKEAETLAVQLIEAKERLYAEAKTYATILNDSSADDKTRETALGKLQETLRGLKQINGKFAAIQAYVPETALYNSSQQNNVDKWNKKYTNSEVRNLEKELKGLEEQLNAEEDQAKAAELKKKIANTKRNLTRLKKSVPDNVSSKKRAELTNIERQLSEEQSKLVADENRKKAADIASSDLQSTKQDATFLTKYNELLEKEKSLLEEVNKLKREGADKSVIDSKTEELKQATKALDDFLRKEKNAERTAYARGQAVEYQAQLHTAYRKRSVFDNQIQGLNDDEENLTKYGLSGRVGSKARRLALRKASDEYMASDEVRAQEEAIRKNEQLSWEQRDKQLKELRQKLREEFAKKFDDTNVQQDELDRIAAERAIAEAGREPLDDIIKDLQTQKKAAMRYGAVSDDDLKNDKYLKQNEQYHKNILDLQSDRVALERELESIKSDDSLDEKKQEKAIKSKQKEIDAIDQEIQRNQALIDNRVKLMELHKQEKEESKQTPEEKALLATEQLIGMKQSLAQAEEKVAARKAEYESAKGTENEIKTLEALDNQIKKRDQIQEQIANTEKKIERLGQVTQKTEDVQDEVASAVEGTSSGKVSGGLLGLIKETLTGSGGVSNEILQVIAETVSQILEVITSGGIKVGADSKVDTTSAKDVMLEKKLARIRTLEAEKAASVNKSTWTAAMSDEERATSVSAITKYDKEAIAKWKGMGADELIKVMHDITQSMDGLNKESVEYLTKQRELGRVLNVYKEKSPVKDEATLTKKNGKSYIHSKMLAEKDDALKQLGLYDKYNPITSDMAVRNMFAVPKDGGFTKEKEEELARLKQEIKEVNATAKDNGGLKDAIPEETDKETDELIAKIERLKQKFEEAKNVGYLDKNDKDLEAFIKQLDDIDTVEKRQKALALGDVVNKKVAKNKRMYSGTTEINAATRQRSNMEARGALDNADLAMVEEYNKAYDALIAKHKEFAVAGTLYDPNNQKTLQNMAIKVKDLGKQLEKSVAEAEQLQQLVDNSGVYNGQSLGSTEHVGKIDDGTFEALAKKRLQELGAEHIRFDKIHKKAIATKRLDNRTVAELEVKYNDLAEAMFTYQKAEKESLTGLPAFLNGFQKKFNSIMQYLSMTMSIHQVMAQLRKGVQYVREIDLALTELKKVTDETEESYDKFLDTAAKTGARLGTTISAVTEATATFAKLGYTMEQATEMAESAIVYKNVGDNIASTEDAANSIISTMKGFRLEATESMAIVDRFNEVKFLPPYTVMYMIKMAISEKF